MFLCVFILKANDASNLMPIILNVVRDCLRLCYFYGVCFSAGLFIFKCAHIVSWRLFSSVHMSFHVVNCELLPSGLIQSVPLPCTAKPARASGFYVRGRGMHVLYRATGNFTVYVCIVEKLPSRLCSCSLLTMTHVFVALHFESAVFGSFVQTGCRLGSFFNGSRCCHGFRSIALLLLFICSFHA